MCTSSSCLYFKNEFYIPHFNVIAANVGAYGMVPVVLIIVFVVQYIK